MISVLIDEYSSNKKFLNLVKLPYSGIRLDRGYFEPLGFDMSRFIDFHAFQQDVFKKREILKVVLEHLLDLEANISIEKYFNEFCEIKYSNN